MWRNNTMRTTIAIMPEYANVSGAFESKRSQNRNTSRTQSVRTPRLTTQWSGRPTAQARCSFLAPYRWAAAHRERSGAQAALYALPAKRGIIRLSIWRIEGLGRYEKKGGGYARI
jgi:hypothetical protein